MTTLPSIMCTMLAMLQDRRRPLWPVAVIVIVSLANLLAIYLLDIRRMELIALPSLIMFIYIGIVLVRAIIQYDRWLLDNYADLEHKEVRTTFMVMVAFALTLIAYSFANGYVFFQLFILVVDILFFIVLLWRVESLQTLEEPAPSDAEGSSAGTDPIADKLTALLQQHCVDAQFYLQHDASLSQLATLIGTNTHYLSDYFARQGLTYNSYINGLRIAHFKRLYQERTQSQLSVTASELVSQSGFRSYSTFSAAFKQISGQTVKEWMEENA